MRTKCLLLMAAIDVGVGVQVDNLDFLLRQLRRCNCCGENDDDIQFDYVFDENDKDAEKVDAADFGAASASEKDVIDLFESLHMCQHFLNSILTTKTITSLKVRGNS